MCIFSPIRITSAISGRKPGAIAMASLPGVVVPFGDGAIVVFAGGNVLTLVDDTD